MQKVVSANLEEVTLQIGEYDVHALQSCETAGKPRVLFSTGCCMPIEFYMTDLDLIAADANVLAVEIVGHHVGKPLGSFEENLDAHLAVLEHAGWEAGTYDAAGHSYGGLINMVLNKTDRPPRHTTAYQSVLGNTMTPEELRDTVYNAATRADRFARFIPNKAKRNSVRTRIARMKANWEQLQEDGTDMAILDAVAGKTTEALYSNIGSGEGKTFYVSETDYLFKATDAAVAALQETLPGAEIILLQDRAYCHSWPVTMPGEMYRLQTEAPREPSRTHTYGAVAVGVGVVAAGLWALAHNAPRPEREVFTVLREPARG